MQRTTNIRDDAEAIARARQAECHELRVLHHIRMRGGRSVASAYNNGEYDDGSSNNISQGRDGESIGQSSVQGSALRPESRSYASTKSKVQPTGFGALHQESSTSNKEKSGSEECDWWCLLKTFLLFYAVIVATILLWLYLQGSKKAESEEEVYDAIP